MAIFPPRPAGVLTRFGTMFEGFREMRLTLSRANPRRCQETVVDLSGKPFLLRPRLLVHETGALPKKFGRMKFYRRLIAEP